MCLLLTDNFCLLWDEQWEYMSLLPTAAHTHTYSAPWRANDLSVCVCFCSQWGGGGCVVCGQATVFGAQMRYITALIYMMCLSKMHLNTAEKLGTLDAYTTWYIYDNWKCSSLQHVCVWGVRWW